MKNKIKAEIRQTNIKNLSELSEEEKFEFQKAFEKEFLKIHNSSIYGEISKSFKYGN